MARAIRSSLSFSGRPLETDARREDPIDAMSWLVDSLPLPAADRALLAALVVRCTLPADLADAPPVDSETSAPCYSCTVGSPAGAPINPEP